MFKFDAARSLLTTGWNNRRGKCCEMEGFQGMLIAKWLTPNASESGWKKLTQATYIGLSARIGALSELKRLAVLTFLLSRNADTGAHQDSSWRSIKWWT